MCLTCGCNQPTEQHGDKRNITIDSLKQAGEAQKISFVQVLRNIILSLPVIAKNWKTYA